MEQGTIAQLASQVARAGEHCLVYMPLLCTHFSEHKVSFSVRVEQ